MPRAISTKSPDEVNSGVMLLALDSSLWDLLLQQAEVEKVSPGAVLSKAVGQYLRHNGGEEIQRLFKAYAAR